MIVSVAARHKYGSARRNNHLYLHMKGTKHGTAVGRTFDCVSGTGSLHNDKLFHVFILSGQDKIEAVMKSGAQYKVT